MARKKVSKPVWHSDALKAVNILRSGGVILHASDTVWGLACDATNSKAVGKMRKLKMRPSNIPLLMLTADEGTIQKHFDDVPDAAWDLFEHSDVPITIVMPNGKNVADGIMAEDGSLGVRLVDDPWCVFVARGLGKPIASSSANKNGTPTPTNFHSIDKQLQSEVDFISAHRRDDNSMTSSSLIVAFDESGRFKILRQR